MNCTTFLIGAFFIFPASGGRPADTHPHERERRAAARQPPPGGGEERSPPSAAQRRESPRRGRRARGREGQRQPGGRGDPAAAGTSAHRAPGWTGAQEARGEPARSPQRTGGARRASTGALQRAKAGGMPPTSARRASAPEDGDARAGEQPATARRRTAEAQKSRPPGGGRLRAYRGSARNGRSGDKGGLERRAIARRAPPTPKPLPLRGRRLRFGCSKGDFVTVGLRPPCCSCAPAHPPSTLPRRFSFSPSCIGFFGCRFHPPRLSGTQFR